MTLDLAKLKEAAEKATSWQWFYNGDGAICFDARYRTCCGRGYLECCGEPDVAGEIGDIAKAETEVDAAYIALANPATILALIERLESAEEIMTAFADEQCDYARINNLGDGEKQHNVKRARCHMEKYK